MELEDIIVRVHMYVDSFLNSESLADIFSFINKVHFHLCTTYPSIDKMLNLFLIILYIYMNSEETLLINNFQEGLIICRFTGMLENV